MNLPPLKSMQTRLILALGGTSVLLTPTSGVLVYHSIRADVVSQFDVSLRAQASALAALISPAQGSEGSKLEFEFNPAAMPEFQRIRHGHYFTVRYGDGRVFASSQSLTGTALPPIAANEGAQDVTTPNGRRARAIRLDFTPQPDPGDPPISLPREPARSFPMNVTVARDRATLDGALNRLLSTLAIAGGLLTLAIAAAVAAIVHVSLRPLRAIGEAVAQVDAVQLHLRIQSENVPTELRPICTRLNDLLARLDQAFARERRFTSDVAHELRTPIAELRSISEIALRWPDDTAASADALRDVHSIAQQMQTLVNTLLALVRAEAQPAVRAEPVALAEALARSLRELGPGVEGRVDARDVPQHACVRVEPTLLASVLRNVISNAVEYAPAGSIVTCRAVRLRGRDDRWLLSVENPTDHFLPQDVAHVFEPFWRKDPARTDSAHTGLGLALVRAYCDLMHARVEVAMSEPGRFTLQLDLPAEVAARPTDPRPPAPMIEPAPLHVIG
jgi:two-component system sensor histidine kinase QseC